MARATASLVPCAALLTLLLGALPVPSGPARKPPGPSPGGTPGQLTAEIRKRLNADYPRLDALYKHFHAHPELSLQEEQTAARLAKELRAAGLKVTARVGGHG